MSEFVKLTCPSCSGKLQIGANIHQFTCSFCGEEYTVNRGGGIVSVEPLVEGLNRIHSGVNQTASELTIPRLERETEVLEAELDELEWNVALWHKRLARLTHLYKERKAQACRTQKASRAWWGVCLSIGAISAFAFLTQNNNPAGWWFLLTALLMTLIIWIRSGRPTGGIEQGRDAPMDDDIKVETALLETRICQGDKELPAKRGQLADKRKQLQHHKAIVSRLP